MPHQELAIFIKEGLSQGFSRDALREALLKARWNAEDVDSALGRFVVSDFPLPVPAPKPSLSAREAFIYLVLFVTLYLTAFSVGSLWFSFINRWFPDELSFFYGNTESLRQACATILITAPLFFGLSFRVRRHLQRHPDERQSGVRKWLSYLTLFVAASVIIGTLIGLVHNVLSGELTWRFSLKALTVLVITGLGFGYYLWDLRQDDVALTQTVQTRVRLFASSMILITIGTLLGGLWLSGSPSQERVRRLDEQRVQTLERLTYSVDMYYTTERRLPVTIDDLWRTRGMTDGDLKALIETQPDFSYQPTASTTYRLCSSFTLPSRELTMEPSMRPAVPSALPIWTHGAGLTCFNLDVREPLR